MYEGGMSQGFGFVCFSSAWEATEAVNAMNGWEVAGKPLYVATAQKKKEEQKSISNLYVHNLDASIDDARLRQIFSGYGAFTSSKVMYEGGMSNGPMSNGIGFVCFSSPWEATEAVNAMNGREVAGKPLYVAPAQTKKERQVYLAEKYKQPIVHMKPIRTHV